MKILVIGQGAREHAIINELHKEHLHHQLFCWPGNPGIAKKAKLIIGNYNDFNYVQTVLQTYHFNLVIIGPEGPLAIGLADFIRSFGVPVFGPNKKASQLESSKIYAKQFMTTAKIPTANFWVINSLNEGLQVAEKLIPPYVLKQDGLCSGKGVSLHYDLLSLDLKLREHFQRSESSILLEEFLYGEELSFLTLISQNKFYALPVAQDYKKKFDHNIGPNTGGMGAIAPIQMPSELQQKILEKIVQPTLNHLRAQNIDFRGVLYFGIICTHEGPKLIEYNVRFGDPEAQAILPLLDGNWSEIFFKISTNKTVDTLNWKNLYTAVVNAVTKNYAETEKSELHLTEGNSFYEAANNYLLHGSTTDQANQIYAKTGRVISSVGIASSQSASLDLAYDALKNIKWSGKFFRTDIGYSNKTLNSLQNKKELLL